MPFNEQFAALKALNTADMDISLAIIKERKVQRQSRYTTEYVQTSVDLRRSLGGIVGRKIAEVEDIRDYGYDIAEPDNDQALAMDIAATDFLRIRAELDGLLPAENLIEDVGELAKAKAYMIIFRNEEGVQLIGYKKLPESWELKQERGLIALIWRGNRFETLGEENVFSISNTVDFISFRDALFISSKKQFETAMNFREGMIARATAFYEEPAVAALFQGLNLLTARVGNNQRYLRKIATIKNLGYYQDQVFLESLRQVSAENHWNVEFAGNQIVLSEANIDEVLVLLQDKRLHSKITDRFFDADFVKEYIANRPAGGS